MNMKGLRTGAKERKPGKRGIGLLVGSAIAAAALAYGVMTDRLECGLPRRPHEQVELPAERNDDCQTYLESEEFRESFEDMLSFRAREVSGSLTKALGAGPDEQIEISVSLRPTRGGTLQIVDAGARSENGNRLDMVALGEIVDLELYGKMVPAHEGGCGLETSVKVWTHIPAEAGL